MKRIIATLILLTSLIFLISSYAIVTAEGIPESGEYMNRADLVIEGEVISVQPSGQFEKSHGKKKQIWQATVKISKIIKGGPKSQIVIDFLEFDRNIDAAFQDTQFELGAKGTIYLQELSNSHYRAIGYAEDIAWSVVLFALIILCVTAVGLIIYYFLHNKMKNKQTQPTNPSWA